jgi:hypothetical protein
MLNEYQKALVNMNVQRAVNKNMDSILSAICERSSDAKEHSTMIADIIRITTSLSMQMMIDFLDESDIASMDFDENDVRRYQMHVVKKTDQPE